jgi:hypothetical protein
MNTVSLPPHRVPIMSGTEPGFTVGIMRYYQCHAKPIFNYKSVQKGDINMTV